MQHPVVGPAKPVLFQNSVGIAGEFPVGEIEQFDVRYDIDVWHPLAVTWRGDALRVYVSHVDLLALIGPCFKSNSDKHRFGVIARGWAS